MNTAISIVGFLAVICLTFVNGGVVCQKGSQIKEITCNGKDINIGKPAPCLLNKGKNATLSVKFVPGTSTKGLTAVCHGIIAGIPVPFSGIEKDGCKGMSPACPINAGTEETYSTEIFVDGKYPSLSLVIRWELVDADTKNSDDVICIQFPAKLV